MSRLIDDKVSIISVLLITSKKGAVRANHYHKKDVHYMYLLQGRMRYTYRNLRVKSSKRRSVIVQKGDLIKTPSMVAHATEFLEDTIFLAFSIRPRDRKSYENDTVRIDLLN